MACETFTNYKNKLDNALDGTPFSGTAPTQRLYAAGLVPGKSLSNCVLVDGVGGLYIGINPADLDLAAVDLETEFFVFILFCNCYSACITNNSAIYGLGDIWPVDGASKYKECGTSGIRTGRPPTLRDNYYYYKLVNKTIRGKIDISSAIGDANVPTITGMYALTASLPSLQSYQSLSDISNLVINCAGENSCFSDQAIGVFESANNTYSFKRWCAKINTTTKIAYGPLKGDLNTLRSAYDAYVNDAFTKGLCSIPNYSEPRYSHKAVDKCPALISCGAESMGGAECIDPFWSTALKGSFTTEGETSSACYIKPYPIRMLDSLHGEACYTSDLFTFFADAMAYLKPLARSCKDDSCLEACNGRDDFITCVAECENAWDEDGFICGIRYSRIINDCARDDGLDDLRTELFARTNTCTSGAIRLCEFQESLNENRDIIVSQLKGDITCTPSDAPNRDCRGSLCCYRWLEEGISCGGGATRCLDDPEDSHAYGGIYYDCGGGVVQNGCECKYSYTPTAITPPIDVYTQTIDRCFKQNVYGSYNIVVKV